MAVKTLSPLTRRDEQSEPERKHFFCKRRHFLAESTQRPMRTMVSSLAYGKWFVLSADDAGSVRWSADHRVLYVRGRPTAIERFQRMVGDVMKEAERLSWGELL